MKATFERAASAKFAVESTGQEVTVSGVPYTWNPAKNPSMDQEGTFAVMRWMRENNVAAGLAKSLIWVSTSPA